MKGGLAIMVGLLALAAALALFGLAHRYELSYDPSQSTTRGQDIDRQGASLRIDRLTGEVCLYDPGQRTVFQPEMTHCAR